MAPVGSRVTLTRRRATTTPTGTGGCCATCPATGSTSAGR
jgi:hypothetical protein